MLNSVVSRRGFLNALGGVIAVTSLPGFTGLAFAADRRFAFVAAADGIHTMEPFGSGWRTRSFICADTPSAMALSADSKTLYVANGTEHYRSLPTGSVTSYHVAAGGTLHRIGSSQLALSAVRPYSLRLSPDHSLLAIASEGGVLSLLALQPNGRLGQVIAVHKTLTSERLTVTFDPNGLLRLDDGSAGRTFRVSPQAGFELMTTGPTATEETVAFDTFGIPDAKAALCVHA
jgi:hypothetical protein